MGWSASWIAVQGASAADTLTALGLEDTGNEVLPGSGKGEFSYHELPNGWLVVFSEYFDGLERQQVLDASRFGLAIGCQFEDRVEMTSIALAAQDGVELWRVFHNSVESTYRLDVTGEPPPELEAARAKAFLKQDADGGEASSTDFVHDVPFEVAKAVCGYRHDEYLPAFHELRRSATWVERAAPPRRSFWRMIFPERSRTR